MTLRETLSFSIRFCRCYTRRSSSSAHESLYEAVHRLNRSLRQVRPEKGAARINGAHAILYSDDADATRAALTNMLGTGSVDAGGWLIFARHRPSSIS